MHYTVKMNCVYISSSFNQWVFHVSFFIGLLLKCTRKLWFCLSICQKYLAFHKKKYISTFLYWQQYLIWKGFPTINNITVLKYIFCLCYHSFMLTVEFWISGTDYIGMMKNVFLTTALSLYIYNIYMTFSEYAFLRQDTYICLVKKIWYKNMVSLNLSTKIMISTVRFVLHVMHTQPSNAKETR